MWATCMICRFDFISTEVQSIQVAPKLWYQRTLEYCLAFRRAFGSICVWELQAHTLGTTLETAGLSHQCKVNPNSVPHVMGSPLDGRPRLEELYLWLSLESWGRRSHLDLCDDSMQSIQSMNMEGCLHLCSQPAY